MSHSTARRPTRAEKFARLTPEQRHVHALSQWFTEPWLADVVAQIAEVRGKRVLEPSCGDGEIVRACLDAGARFVVAVELDPNLASRTQRRFHGHLVSDHPKRSPKRAAMEVVRADFLTWRTGIGADVAAANVPYENGADALHLEHALKLAPRAVAILRLAALAGAERYERLWSRYDARQIFVLPQRPDFGREARRVGLVSNGAESDFVVVDVLARAPRPGSRPSLTWLRRPHT